MIRHIVALDEQRGMAKDHAMPQWQLKGDEAFFTEQTKLYGGNVLMGMGTFVEALHQHPLVGRVNYVATYDEQPIKGATVVNNLERFVHDWPESKDLWIIGGSEIFTQTMPNVDELYITEIAGNFDCDRFYPEYKGQFELKSHSGPHTEHDVTYRYCVYVPLKK